MCQDDKHITEQEFSKNWWKQAINEDLLPEDQRKNIIEEFSDFCSEVLDLEGIDIHITENKSDTKTYAYYDPNKNEAWVYVKNRNLGDILRSLAHELVHAKQNKLGLLNEKSGITGSEHENQANSIAAIFIREFGRIRPEIYE